MESEIRRFQSKRPFNSPTIHCYLLSSSSSREGSSSLFPNLGHAEKYNLFCFVLFICLCGQCYFRKNVISAFLFTAAIQCKSSSETLTFSFECFVCLFVSTNVQVVQNLPFHRHFENVFECFVCLFVCYYKCISRVKICHFTDTSKMQRSGRHCVNNSTLLGHYTRYLQLNRSCDCLFILRLRKLRTGTFVNKGIVPTLLLADVAAFRRTTFIVPKSGIRWPHLTAAFKSTFIVVWFSCNPVTTTVTKS